MNNNQINLSIMNDPCGDPTDAYGDVKSDGKGYYYKKRPSYEDAKARFCFRIINRR